MPEQPKPLTPEQAASLLKEEFPAFADASDETILINPSTGSYKFSLSLQNIHIDCQLYGSVWFLRLRNRQINANSGTVDPSSVDVLVTHQPSLPAASKTLRQAAAEQVQVLGLLLGLELELGLLAIEPEEKP